MTVVTGPYRDRMGGTPRNRESDHSVTAVGTRSEESGHRVFSIYAAHRGQKGPGEATILIDDDIEA